jgi:hypothetical protein
MSTIMFDLDERMRFDGLTSPLLPGQHGHVSRVLSTASNEGECPQHQQKGQQQQQQPNGHATTPALSQHMTSANNKGADCCDPLGNNAMNKRLAPPVPPKNPNINMRIALPALPGDDST